jgi:hypothetical protein
LYFVFVITYRVLVAVVFRETEMIFYRSNVSNSTRYLKLAGGSQWHKMVKMGKVPHNQTPIPHEKNSPFYPILPHFMPLQNFFLVYFVKI